MFYRKFIKLYINTKTSTHIHRKWWIFRVEYFRRTLHKLSENSRIISHRIRCIMFDLYLNRANRRRGRRFLMPAQHSWWKPILKMANALALPNGCCMLLFWCMFVLCVCVCFFFEKATATPKIYNMCWRVKCETIYCRLLFPILYNVYSSM